MEKKIEVRVIDATKGRGLFALKSFKQGDVIFDEQPIISCQFLWNALYRYKACDHCLRSMETAEEMCRRLTGNACVTLPHTECDGVNHLQTVQCDGCKVWYCSAECQNHAWNSYHQVLCIPPDADHPLVRLQEAWRNIHYPPETASIMLIVRMIAAIKQSQDKGHLLATFDQFCKSASNDEEEIAHKLLGQAFQEQLELLRHLVKEALYEDSVQQWYTAEGFRSLFALVGTNGQGIGTSSLSEWVHQCDRLTLPEDTRQELDSFIDQLYVDIEKESGTFLNCEGSGLYALQSACNHSCKPNAEIQFNHGNHVLSLVATDDIATEEEIQICYLDECQRNRSRHSRQKILRENYLFHCQCVRCLAESDQPDVTSSEEEESDMES